MLKNALVVTLMMGLLLLGGYINGEAAPQALQPEAARQEIREGETTLSRTKEENRSIVKVEGGYGYVTRPGTSRAYRNTREGEEALQESLGSGEGYKQSDTVTVAAYPGPQIRYIRDGDSLGANVWDSINANPLGLFEITAYTAGPESTGKTPDHPEYGITFSGKRVKENHTIAADLSILPLGTVLFIEGVGIRTVEDKGGAIKGNKLDLYIEDLDAALTWGRRTREVYLIEMGVAQ